MRNAQPSCTSRRSLSTGLWPWQSLMFTLLVPAVTTGAAFVFHSCPLSAWNHRSPFPSSRSCESLLSAGRGGAYSLGTSSRWKRRHQQQQQQQHRRCWSGRAAAPSGFLTATMGAGIMAQGEGDRASGWGGSSSIESLSSIAGEDNLLSPVLIKVIGVGGGGGNAVDGMITTATRKLAGVEFVAMNTDTQALTKSRAEVKIALGSGVTRGLGAGGKPEVGQAAAKESLPDIEKVLAGADMVFVTAGMGGGTGTGAAPVIAAAARDMGCLTVAVVTEPFEFEGRQRSRQASAGVAELRKCADTVLVVDNDRLLEIVPGRMTMSDAFLVADDVLRQGVIGTSEIIVRPGLINVDFADVREVVKNSGTALIGIGTGTGKTRAEDAAVGAICSPLLDFPINQASGVIFNIVGGVDMSLTEVNAAAGIIQANVHADANIIVGALVDERCGKQVSVTVLATGFELPDGGGVAMEGSYPAAAEARSNVGGGYPAAAEARSNVGGRGEGGLGDEISGGGQQQQAPPSRPCFDGRANDGGGRGAGIDVPPKKKGSLFRRLLGRRD